MTAPRENGTYRVLVRSVAYRLAPPAEGLRKAEGAGLKAAETDTSHDTAAEDEQEDGADLG